MSTIEKNNHELFPEVTLTDIAGAETVLQVRLPLVLVQNAIVDSREVYRFPQTPSGDASGTVISELIASENHHLDKIAIKNLGVNRIASLARTAGNINKRIFPFTGYNPIEIQRDGDNTYGFGGLKLLVVDEGKKLKIPMSKNGEAYLGHIPTPLESRLEKSGVDIHGMTLAEKRVVDSLRSRAGVHLNIESIIELLAMDYNTTVNTEYVARTLSNLLNRNKAGRLPKIQFRVIGGDLRVQWQQAEVLRAERNDFNEQPKTTEGISMVPLKWRD